MMLFRGAMSAFGTKRFGRVCLGADAQVDDDVLDHRGTSFRGYQVKIKVLQHAAFALGCCARAANGQILAEPATTLMKSRRRIAFTKAGTTPNGTRLQQGFPTGGMGSDRQFAWQQSSRPDVRFGSKADIARGGQPPPIRSPRRQWQGRPRVKKNGSEETSSASGLICPNF